MLKPGCTLSILEDKVHLVSGVLGETWFGKEPNSWYMEGGHEVEVPSWNWEPVGDTKLGGRVAEVEAIRGKLGHVSLLLAIISRDNCSDCLSVVLIRAGLIVDYNVVVGKTCVFVGVEKIAVASHWS